jgi:hypothetical protein
MRNGQWQDPKIEAAEGSRRGQSVILAVFESTPFKPAE